VAWLRPCEGIRESGWNLRLGRGGGSVAGVGRPFRDIYIQFG